MFAVFHTELAGRKDAVALLKEAEWLYGVMREMEAERFCADGKLDATAADVVTRLMGELSCACTCDGALVVSPRPAMM